MCRAEIVGIVVVFVDKFHMEWVSDKPAHLSLVFG
jgi:hypothetical protein